MRALAVLASALLLAALLLAWFVESRSPAPVPLTPTLTGEIEYCLTCHGDLPEISPAHAGTDLRLRALSRRRAAGSRR